MGTVYINRVDIPKPICVRQARIGDIKEIQIVRNSVIENTLTGPALVSDKDYEEFL